MTKTKILATLGPASWDKLDDLIRAGLDGFRINMSHTKDYSAMAKLIEQIREKAPLAFINADLAGPKIRLGTLETPITITKDQIIRISPEGNCSSGEVPIQVPFVYKHVEPGYTLLINDGAVGLEVTDIKDSTMITKVMWGNLLESRKGVNIPHASIPIPFMSEKDKDDVRNLMNNCVDFISASYTRSVDDLKQLKEYMSDYVVRERTTKDVRVPKLIAKIENHEGIKNFDSILAYTDGVMVARGDLGMEIDPIYVPENQKMMIEKCNIAGKIVITATQMLEGMIDSKEPKRAEISDIFNAVLDGTDVTMLSGETSTGHFPVEAVQTMNQTLDRAELYLMQKGRAKEIARMVAESLGNMPADLISGAVNAIADSDNIKAIVTPTTRGYTPSRIARFRHNVPIIALTQDVYTARQLNAVFGVNAYLASLDQSDLVNSSLKYISEKEILPKGSRVLVTAGMGSYGQGTTNILRVEEVK